jgi:glutamate/tyrosine decarboxylase-like PLP-dependent enzyme
MRIAFPEKGRAAEDLLREMEGMKAGDADWRSGRVPLYVFGATPEVEAIGKAAFNAFFTENALCARRAFASLRRMEDEVVAMALDLFGAPEGATGCMTTSGTESIVLAVQACRVHERARRSMPGLTQRPRDIHRMMSLLHEPAMPVYLSDLAACDAAVRDAGGAASSRSATY